MALARDAQHRCTETQSYDAIAAIVLAYAAYEAFVNELGQLAATVVYEADHAEENPMLEYHDPSVVDRLRSFAESMTEAIRARESTDARYDLAWRHFAGTPAKLGEGTRQQLAELSRLRNELVHLKSERSFITNAGTFDEKPEGFDGEWLGFFHARHATPAFLRPLIARKLVRPEGEGLRWVTRICTPAVAQWACTVVETAAEELVGHTPHGSRFRERLEEQSLRNRR